jgi:hypothetical protein
MRKIKYEKYDEWSDTVFKQALEKLYKQSYRRHWFISDLTRLNDKKWLVKWGRKI